MNLTRFLAGMQDCQDGKKPQSEDPCYQRGYAAEYEMQQIRTHESMKKEVKESRTR